MSTKPVQVRAPAAIMVDGGRTLLGVPIRLICRAPGEREAVQAATAHWRGETDPTAKPLTIHVQSCAGLDGTSPLQFDVSGSQLVLRGRGIHGLANPARQSARCDLSPDWFDRPADLLTLVLEPLALFMATQNARTPIHASGIRLGQTAILFAGRSGAGKSSLAMAAHRAGLTVMSEDTVYVRSQPELAIWGWNGPIHLLPGEAPPAAPVRIRNGRAKHAVAFENAASDTEPPKSAVVCILRHAARPSLLPLGTRAALDLLAPLEPGFDLLAPAVHAAQRQLCKNGAWLLGLSKSPDEAIALVLENLDRLREARTDRGVETVSPVPGFGAQPSH
jgi:hypothetical protein